MGNNVERYFNVVFDLSNGTVLAKEKRLSKFSQSVS